MRGPVSKRWMVIFFLPGFGGRLPNARTRPPPPRSRLSQPRSYRLRRRAPCVAAREQAAAQESSLQRAIAVHAATTEAGRFTGGVEPRHDPAVLAEHA